MSGCISVRKCVAEWFAYFRTLGSKTSHGAQHTHLNLETCRVGMRLFTFVCLLIALLPKVDKINPVFVSRAIPQLSFALRIFETYESSIQFLHSDNQRPLPSAPKTSCNVDLSSPMNQTCTTRAFVVHSAASNHSKQHRIKLRYIRMFCAFDRICNITVCEKV